MISNNVTTEGLTALPPVSAHGASGGTIWTASIDSVAGARDLIPKWQDLVESAIERNVFYEPWTLIPAWEEFAGQSQSVRLVLVYLHVDGHNGDRLIGLFPVSSKTSYHRLPLRAVTLWRHLHCPLCTPLIRSGFERQALEGFFNWLDSPESDSSIAVFENVAGDGPFWESLEKYLKTTSRRFTEDDQYERALMRPSQNSEEYLANALSGKRRKELRRQYKRLSELGKLEAVELTAGDNLETWLDQFHELETESWKGRHGTAISEHGSERRYFDTTSRAAFERGQLMMLALRLDGRPIAMKYNFLSGNGSFSAKIAFDERYAQYSPGVQLELHNINVLHRRPEIQWMDSCAMPNHFMIERLWTERRQIKSLAVGGRSFKAVVLLALLPVLLHMFRKLRRKG